MTDILNQIILLLGGTTVILAALFGFIGKIWLSQLIESEKNSRQTELETLKASLSETSKKLDAQLQSSIHIDKIQFEHEFHIYKEVWESLVELRMATLRLRPTMDSVDPSESKEERMQKRLKSFGVGFEKFRGLIEKNKPFYPENVYASLMLILDKCYGESIDYEYTDRKRGEYFKEARSNQKEIIEEIERACNAIRLRIQEVKVV